VEEQGRRMSWQVIEGKAAAAMHAQPGIATMEEAV
jgi:hypothetical protein